MGLESYEEAAARRAEEEHRARVEQAKGRARAAAALEEGLRRARVREAAEYESGEAQRKAAQSSACCAAQVMHTAEGVICKFCGKVQP
jgi:hypothetical protein